MSGLPDAISLTLFSDRHAKSMRTERWALEQMAHAITNATAARKDELPWLKLGRFGNTRSSKGSLRHDANLVAVSGIEADYDRGDLPFQAAVDLLEQRGLGAVAYTSPSHTEDAPRWRVLCPFSRELEPHQRRHMAGRLNGLFRGVFARETFTLSQAFYFGSVQRNPSHQVHLIDGFPIDADDDLDAVWIGPAETTAGDPGNPGAVPIADAEHIRQVVTGESYHLALCALAGRYVGRGMSSESVDETLRGLMLSHPPESRDERWHTRFGEIGALVASAEVKYKPPADHRKALASLAGRLIRAKKTEAEILAEVYAAAEATGVANKVAREIANWVAEKEIARRKNNV